MRAAGLLRVAALALIWGSGFLLIKISLRSFTPVELTFARLALGALILTAILLVRRLALPEQRTLWLHLLAAALLGNAIPYTLFGVAEQTVESNLAGAINATTPLWTLLFAAALRQSKRLGSAQILGIILGFFGALLILAPWRSDSAPLPGVLACLAASASYGLSYVYMGRYLTGRNLSPLVLSAGQLIAASGLLALALPFGGTQGGNWRPDAVAALLVLGVVGTGLAYVLNYRIITDDGPVLASTVTYLLPVVAVLAGLLVLDESVTVPLIAGVAIVLLGVGLTRRKPAQ
jgi:drug/metabolite transporter (DMT)-like permease